MRDNVAFARHLRQLRLAAGLSQNALSRAAGVSQGKVSQWEKGRAITLITALPRLAAALGCRMNDLFTDPAEGLPDKSGS